MPPEVRHRKYGKVSLLAHIAFPLLPLAQYLCGFGKFKLRHYPWRAGYIGTEGKRNGALGNDKGTSPQMKRAFRHHISLLSGLAPAEVI